MNASTMGSTGKTLFENARAAVASLTGRQRMFDLFSTLFKLLDEHEDELAQYLDSLGEDAPRDPQEQADSQLLRALLCFQSETDAEADECFSLSMKLLRQQSEDDQADQLCDQIVSMYAEAQESQAVIPYALDCVSRYEAAGDELRLARMLNNLGVAYINVHQPSKALPLLKRSVALNRKHDNVDLVQSYNNLASLYYRVNLYDKALATYKLALDACQEFDIEQMRPIILGNLANINTDLCNYDNALSYYQEALKGNATNLMSRAVTLNNIGKVYVCKGDNAAAIKRFEQSLQLCRENRLAYTEAMNLYQLGQAHMELGRYPEAHAMLLDALDKIEKTGDVSMLAEAQTCLARLFVALERYDDALALLSRAHDIQKANDVDTLGTERAYIELYRAVGDIEQLAAHQAALIELHETMQKEEFTQLLAEMQATLDLELKEKEAEMQRQKAEELQKKNEEILQQKRQLERTLEELRKSEISFAFLQQEYKDQLGDMIIGESEEMKRLLSLIRMVASASDTSVLISGETGTGKELVARAIHELSSRKRRNFCAVNVAGIPDTLFESEFFGYRKSAFTGADRDKAGWFEIANEGTLFLDEVGAWRYDVQSKFLRVLESRKVIPVGGDREIAVDFRLISATNDDLQSMIRENSFRADLYYRLSSFVIHIPPLRERIEDIPPLLEYFVNHFNQRMNKKITRIEKQVEEALREYSFPGNVRELRNMVEHAMIISNTSTLRLTSFSIPQQGFDDIVIPLAELEREMILKALKRTGHHQSKAAELLGLTPKSIERRMKKYDIVNPKRQ